MSTVDPLLLTVEMPRHEEVLVDEIPIVDSERQQVVMMMFLRIKVRFRSLSHK